MGCDIHLYVEARREGKWEHVAAEWPCMDCHGTGRIRDSQCWRCHGKGSHDKFYDHRNYLLFSVLADVRNYHEFPVTPMHDGRGLPDDVSSAILERAGDPDWHSKSWATLAELRAYDWAALPERWCDSFVDRLHLLDTLGTPEDVRLVYWFDN